MPDFWELEAGGKWRLENDSGNWLLEKQPKQFEIDLKVTGTITVIDD